MADRSHGFQWVNRLAKVCLIVALVLLAGSLVGAIAALVRIAIAGWQWEAAIPWLLVIPGVVLGAVLAGLVYGLVRVVVANERAVAENAGRLGRLETLTEDGRQLIVRLAEYASLSDQAKSLVFRDKELQAIREAFHSDLMHQDYRTAESLVQAVENRLGYADEAERMRQEIEQSRNATVSEKVDRAISRVDESIRRHDWEQATRQANRLMQAFPHQEKVHRLGERIDAARAQHKRELLKQYGEAVRKNDIDRSIELLQELDRYLTPQEGAALEESARGVFKAKLHSLGVQFAILVTDQQWDKALETGEQIMNEFPNTRMAQEVRQRIDQLRTRAEQARSEQAPARAE
ncbi:MAG: hypothetical protein ACOC93_06735 [Planctomycetota bacterium]